MLQMSVPSVAPKSMKGERVAFTGRLASMSRQRANEMVRNAGGRLTQSISRETTLLVVGMKGWPLRRTGELSSKLRAAEHLVQRGSRLRLLSEEQFLEEIGLKDEQPAVHKSMPADQVCDLVGVTPDVLRRWEAHGLVRSRHGCYDFQDLVSLQTIAALVAQGANARVIAQSVRSLSQVLPGTDRPLAQLKLLSERHGLAAEVNGCLIDSSGQLLMRFDEETQPGAPELPDGPLTLSAPAGVAEKSAGELFAIGSEYEEVDDFAAAERAYREALAIQPHAPSVNFNLANVLRHLDRVDAAEERFRVAIEQDPELTSAWYNLADLLEEQGRVHDAIHCLRKVVTIDPDYGDAHYNLACCCEKADLPEEARRHWREYLRIDPSSEWAALAKHRLSG
jgi:tetratricopeptide (TPR) repeat protein